MDRTLEGADPVHRVKRGRPAKAPVETGLGGAHQPAVETLIGARSESDAYAARVWAGQSVDVPRAERIARVLAALKGQGLPTDGVKIPEVSE